MAKEKQETESEILNETETTKELTVKNQGNEVISQTKANLSSSNLIKEFEREQLKKQLPEIYVGDTVKVGVKITEGNKERVQPYEGVVIAKRHGGLNQPMPRMTNTYMLGGNEAPEEIIKSVKNGLYAVNFSGGQVDIVSGKFVFAASEAYLIEDGKITDPVKGATLIGNGPEAMNKISMIGNDMKLDDGVGTCGKDGQGVPVGVGQPTLKMNGITVGGTAV